MNRRKAKISEIKIWYKFRPTISIWTSKSKGRTHMFKLPDETWYDGYPFIRGVFIFLQFKYFAIHVKFSWWKIKL